MSTSDTAVLSPDFQISLPKDLRDAHGWDVGQEFAFVPKGHGVLLMPVPRRQDLPGLAKGARAADYRDRNDRT